MAKKKALMVGLAFVILFFVGFLNCETTAITCIKSFNISSYAPHTHTLTCFIASFTSNLFEMRYVATIILLLLPMPIVHL